MCKQFRNYYLPERIKGMIDLYVDHGISGGSCLDAILSNNLRESFREQTKRFLPACSRS